MGNRRIRISTMRTWKGGAIVACEILDPQMIQRQFSSDWYVKKWNWICQDLVTKLCAKHDVAYSMTILKEREIGKLSEIEMSTTWLPKLLHFSRQQCLL